MKISFCIITYNEEKNIKELIENIKDVSDEIVIVDRFSQDNTCEIAKSLGAVVYRRKWVDYTTQKNRALELAKNEWVFFMDADERLSEELKDEIKKLKDTETDCDGFLIKRKANYLGRWINHSGWYPDKRVRLFKKGKGKFYGKYIHEGLNFSGKSCELKGDLYHYAYESILEHVDKTKKYAMLSAKRMIEEGKDFSMVKLFFSPILRFIKHYFFRLGFLDGIRGFLIAFLSAYYVFLKYSFLWEINKNENSSYNI